MYFLSIQWSYRRTKNFYSCYFCGGNIIDNQRIKIIYFLRHGEVKIVLKFLKVNKNHLVFLEETSITNFRPSFG